MLPFSQKYPATLQAPGQNTIAVSMYAMEAILIPTTGLFWRRIEWLYGIVLGNTEHTRVFVIGLKISGVPSQYNNISPLSSRISEPAKLSNPTKSAVAYTKYRGQAVGFEDQISLVLGVITNVSMVRRSNMVSKTLIRI